MYQEALKLRDVLSCTIADSIIAVDFVDSMLTIDDWNHIQAMEQWLLLPARICTYLSGSKYPTLSLASLAFNGMLSHCNKYLGVDVESIESNTSKVTIEVQEKASDKCLQYLRRYQESLKSIPSRIATFLDPRYVALLIAFFIHNKLIGIFFSIILLAPLVTYQFDPTPIPAANIFLDELGCRCKHVIPRCFGFDADMLSLSHDNNVTIFRWHHGQFKWGCCLGMLSLLHNAHLRYQKALSVGSHLF